MGILLKHALTNDISQLNDSTLSSGYFLLKKKIPDNTVIFHLNKKSMFFFLFILHEFMYYSLLSR